MPKFQLHPQNVRRYKTDLAHVRPWFKLRDGRKVRIRLLSPSDRDLLIDFFLRLSPESRWRRFHANVEHVSHTLIEDRAVELAEVDNQIMGAVIALFDAPDGEHMIGSARLAREEQTPTSPEAEAAIVVRDDFQGQGLGQELLRRMVLLAKQMQVKTIVATFQPDNEEAIRLFRELNLPSTLQIHHGATEMRIQVPE